MFNATSDTKRWTKTAEVMLDRTSSLAPNHKLVLSNMYERKGREIHDLVHDYPIYDQAGTKYGDITDNGKEILLLMDIQ